MKIITKTLAVLAITAWAGAANATPITIDFDDLASGVVVGGSYSGIGVTFVDAVTSSTIGGLAGASSPNGISHVSSGFQPQQSDPIEAIFGSAVSMVGLTGIDVGTHGFILSVFDAVSGGNLLATDQVFGSDIGVGEFFTLNLSAAGILRAEFSQVSNTGAGDGMGFDDFTFDTGSAVPAPATLALLGLGLAGLGWSRRKKA